MPAEKRKLAVIVVCIALLAVWGEDCGNHRIDWACHIPICKGFDPGADADQGFRPRYWRSKKLGFKFQVQRLI